jgi:streptogramin lyase
MRRTRDHQLRALACAFFLAMVEPPSTASAAAITEFPLPAPSFCSPCPIFFAGAITAGPDGNLWFTDLLGTRIGRITPDGVITEFSLPTAGETSAITAGPDGNVWFVGGNRIGRITPAGVLTEFPIPTLARGPNQITAAPDGNLWFTETQAAKIGRITPAGAIIEFPVPTTDSGPSSITAGPDGNVWLRCRVPTSGSAP